MPKAKNNQFLKVPKELFTNESYKKISPEAKLLYCLMLDRRKLSEMNERFICGEPFIFYSREEACEVLDCGKDKATKLFTELEKHKLIRRKKRDTHNPMFIFVADILKSENQDKKTFSEKLTNSSTKNEFSNPIKADFPPCEELISTESEDAISAPNNTYNNKTEVINTVLNQTADVKQGGKNNISEIIFEVNSAIDIETLKENIPSSAEAIEEIRDIIAEVIIGRRKIKSEGNIIPPDCAASRFRMLRYEHISELLDSLAVTELKKIKCVDSYIAAALYNLTFTLNSRNEIGWKHFT